MNILPFESINIESIQLGPMEPGIDGISYISEITDLCDANILPQTFKLKNLDDEKVELEFLPLSANFYAFVKNVDNHIVQYLFDNSELLFGSKVSYETINQLYERSLKLPEKIPAFPHMIIVVDPKCVFLDKDKFEVDMNSIPIGSEVTPILRLTDIVFNKNKYSLTWEVSIIKVENNLSTNFDYLFDNGGLGQHTENSEIIIANSLSDYTNNTNNTDDSDSSIEFETDDSSE